MKTILSITLLVLASTLLQACMTNKAPHVVHVPSARQGKDTERLIVTETKGNITRIYLERKE